MLRPEYAGQPAAEARFRREATTAARLRHPNIVFIRDVGEAEGTVFVAMDLLPLSLARRLEVLPRLPEAEVVRFALDVAAALSIAHADGIVHRDIKPDNVMLGANGEAIVADFGLADAFTTEAGKNAADPGSTGKVMGTPHYFSPEQARGLDLDGRTDLYSLGIMCYRAATGTLPFEGDDWYSVARQHVEDTPVPPRMLVPELTEGFEAIVLRLLAKQPEQRFASATLLADALLMLPTAPVSRSVGLVPAAASVTQVAFPYVHSVVEPVRRHWRRNSALGIALIGAAAVAFFVFAMPGLSAFGNRAAPDTTTLTPPLTSPDTTARTPGDSTIANADTAKAPLLAIKPPVVRTTPVVRPPAGPQRVHVMLSAPDSASLSVNGVVVARGSWEGDLPIGKHVFRARLLDAIPGCRAAEVDSNVTFSSAFSTNIELDVARCAVLLLTIRSNEANFTITPRDFPVGERSGLYHGTPQPFVLRMGMYDLRVHSDRCADYSDTVTVTRNRVTGSDTVSRVVSLLCQDH